jgi:hypothetical protein
MLRVLVSWAIADAAMTLMLKRGEVVKIKREEDASALIEHNGREARFVPTDAYIVIPHN